jgi:hypothetical protein
VKDIGNNFTGENPGKTTVPLTILYSDFIAVQSLLYCNGSLPENTIHPP